VRALAADRAIELLERLLTGRHSVALVADVDWSRVAVATRRTPPLLRALVRPKARSATESGKPPAAGSYEVPVLEGLDDGARRAVLTSYLCATMAAVLGIRGRPVEEDAEIAHLGFDSLMAVQLRNRIEIELGVLVPVGEMLQAATPAEVAEALNLRLSTTPLVKTAATSPAPTFTEGEI
jgi:acyl carrier protein